MKFREPKFSNHYYSREEKGMTSKRLCTMLVMVLTFVAVFALTISQALALPSYVGNIPDGLDKSCSLCHDGAPSKDNVNDFGKKWVAAGKDFSAMNSGAKKEEPTTAPQKTTKAASNVTSKASSTGNQTVTFTYGSKSVKAKAVNKNKHLQVEAGVLQDLFGIEVNDKTAMVPLRQIAENMGLTVNYKNGKVDFYGAVVPIGQFGKNPALALTGYVGPSTCAGCHSDMVSKWKTTKHATMVQDIDDANAWIVANFQTNTYYTKDDVEYAVAQGQRFLTTKDGILQYMPATWNMETNQWDKGSWRAYSCGKCHNTGFNAKTGYWFENGITCESCHGPGAEHAATADPTKIKVSTGVEMCQPCHDEGSHNQVTAMVADAKAEQANDAAVESHLNVLKDSKTDPKGHYGDSCTACHSAEVRLALENGTEPPTWDELKDGPRNGITCVVCHDPHQNTGNERQLKSPAAAEIEHAGLDAEQLAANWSMPNQLCASCHTNEGLPVAGKAAHHPQKEWFDGQVIGLDIPAPNGHECVTCHMGNGNHYFEAGKPNFEFESHGAKEELNVCGQCHDENDMTAAKIAGIQKATEAMYEELQGRLTAAKAKLDAAVAAGADVSQAKELYDANFTNVGLLDSEGSWGLHNNALTNAVIAKAKKDLATIESLLAAY